MSDYWSNLMGSDEAAANYMHSYGEGVGTETRDRIGAMIKLNDTVLDVGCGPAWNYDHFKANGPLVGRYKGTDLSERFVRVANHRHPGIAEIGDCRDIREEDNSWDVVILQDIVEHTNGYEETVEQALRVAIKKVIVTFWRMNHTGRNKTNDDRDKGDEGYGSEYDQTIWEEYLDKLEAEGKISNWWRTESSPEANRWHLFYELTK